MNPNNPNLCVVCGGMVRDDYMLMDDVWVAVRGVEESILTWSWLPGNAHEVSNSESAGLRRF